jgi:peptide/nickel transport system permease protein
MRLLILTRLGGLVATAFVSTLIIFFALRVIPGDPAVQIAGEGATEAMIEETRQRLGLHRDIGVQYLDYLRRLLVGDLGLSFRSGGPVASELARGFPATIELATGAVLLGLLVGVPLGLLAVRSRGLARRLAEITSASVIGIPPFWLGLLAIILFYGTLGWLPGGGRMPLEGLGIKTRTGLLTVDSLIQGDFRALAIALQHLVLPTITLSTAVIGLIARTTRAAVAEALAQPHVVVARSKGLSERVVYARHALRNAAIPIITVLGLALGDLLGGAVLTETIFGWPGIGRYAISSILDSDYNAVMGFVVTLALAYATINAVVDLTIYKLDPRISIR